MSGSRTMISERKQSTFSNSYIALVHFDSFAAFCLEVVLLGRMLIHATSFHAMA